MKEPELNKSISQMLQEFELMENIQLSPGWSKSLMNKVNAAKPYSSASNSTSMFNTLLYILILVNLGFVLNLVITDSHQLKVHNAAMQTISNELLINNETSN